MQISNISKMKNTSMTPIQKIYRTIKYMHISCKIFGLEPTIYELKSDGSFNVENSKHDLIYHVLYCSIFTILGGYTTSTLLLENNKSFKSSRSKFALLIAVIILLMFIIISGNYSMRKKITSSLISFERIDTAFLRFDMEIEYDILRKDSIVSLILMFSSIIIRSVTLIILIDMDILQSATVFIALSVKALTKYQFISYVKQLNIRFERINIGLNEIFERKLKNKIIFNHVNRENEISDEMLVLCRLHYKLCHLMKSLSRAFGLQQLTSIGVSICNILFQTFYLYYVLTGKDEKNFITIVSPLLWSIDEMIEIQLLVAACSEVCDNANSTAAILHEMRNSHYNITLEDHVQTYSLQMLHQKIQFTAMGYFVIDYTLTYSIIGAVTTYLVIFIQFDQGQNTPNEMINGTADGITLLKTTPTTLALN